ncbi:acyl-CoA dehydrogenase family protein [Rhodococcoides kyotonense]|uniref:Acyl-CoA dehydrogenase n=1 Tax=Rhodococcoides kyotonense TaxID=398843 RepID=A0A239K9U2_9NOCA|nr:acyl-CoA dehydrogenase family protein [Rhodococcus kyotonensis]SNT14462.1 acyl-CoA dehydrogenase [Rhodococcus kyotonensis]
MKIFETEERVALKDMVRNFAEKEVAPNIDQWERDGFIPMELHARAAEVGILGIGFDEAVGGSGGDLIDFCVMGEELILSGRSSGLMMALFTHRVALAPLISCGTPEQVEKFVRPTLEGRMVVALGITEPEGGSDVAGLRTTARRDGDDYIVNGSKTFISSGVRADAVVTAVRTGEPGHQGLSLLVIEKNTPGFEVTRRLDKMGWDCSDTAELAFTDVRVPAANLIGVENGGFRLIMELFQHERLGQAGMAYGIAKRSLDLAVEWCRERSTFGRPLIQRQVVRHRLAEMAQAVDVSGQYLKNTIVRVSEGEIIVPQVCWAKLEATKASSFVVDRALQLHGGSGYMRDTEINRHYRDARVMSIAGGTDEIMTEIVTKWMGFA